MAGETERARARRAELDEQAEARARDKEQLTARLTELEQGQAEGRREQHRLDEQLAELARDRVKLEAAAAVLERLGIVADEPPECEWCRDACDNCKQIDCVCEAGPHKDSEPEPEPEPMVYPALDDVFEVEPPGQRRTPLARGWPTKNTTGVVHQSGVYSDIWWCLSNRPMRSRELQLVTGRSGSAIMEALSRMRDAGMVEQPDGKGKDYYLACDLATARERRPQLDQGREAFDVEAGETGSRADVHANDAAVLEAVRDGNVGSGNIRKATGLHKSTVKRALDRLVDAGKLHRSGPARAYRYRINREAPAPASEPTSKADELGAAAEAKSKAEVPAEDPVAAFMAAGKGTKLPPVGSKELQELNEKRGGVDAAKW